MYMYIYIDRHMWIYKQINAKIYVHAYRYVYLVKYIIYFEHVDKLYIYYIVKNKIYQTECFLKRDLFSL